MFAQMEIPINAEVNCADGPGGDTTCVIVDPADGHITHLILRKGHVWGHQDVSIPADQIDRMEADTIYLKLDKHTIANPRRLRCGGNNNISPRRTMERNDLDDKATRQ